MSQEIMLDSQAAIKYVMNTLEFTSYYAIAKELTKHGIKVQAIQISNYHKGKRAMGNKVAKHFEDVFGITIADAHQSKGRPSEW